MDSVDVVTLFILMTSGSMVTFASGIRAGRGNTRSCSYRYPIVSSYVTATVIISPDTVKRHLQRVAGIGRCTKGNMAN